MWTFIIILAILVNLAVIANAWTKWIENNGIESSDNIYLSEKNAKNTAINDMADEFNGNYLHYDNFFKEDYL